MTEVSRERWTRRSRKQDLETIITALKEHAIGEENAMTVRQVAEVAFYTSDNAMVQYVSTTLSKMWWETTNIDGMIVWRDKKMERTARDRGRYRYHLRERLEKRATEWTKKPEEETEDVAAPQESKNKEPDKESDTAPRESLQVIAEALIGIEHAMESLVEEQRKTRELLRTVHGLEEEEAEEEPQSPPDDMSAVTPCSSPRKPSRKRRNAVRESSLSDRTADRLSSATAADAHRSGYGVSFREGEERAAQAESRKCRPHRVGWTRQAVHAIDSSVKTLNIPYIRVPGPLGDVAKVATCALIKMGLLKSKEGEQVATG